MKDLRVIKNLDLAQTLLLDNYVWSFAFHLDNGIPVVPYFGEPDDTELIKVMKYIVSIHDSTDFREDNKKQF